MKYWQLQTCLADDNDLFSESFGAINMIQFGNLEVQDDLVEAILNQSKKYFYVTKHNYLRLYPEVNLYITETQEYFDEIMSIEQAFKKYGGNALTEVFDYGSFNLNTLSS